MVLGSWIPRGAVAALVACWLPMGVLAQAPRATDPVDPLRPVTREAAKSPLLTEPVSPPDLLRAVTLMLDLGNADFARKYLEKLEATVAADDAALLQLRDKEGPSVFLRLAREDATRPIGIRLLERINQLLAGRATDGDYVRGRIALLSDERRRQQALDELQNMGPRVLPLLFDTLRTADRPEMREGTVLGILRFGPQAVPALAAALDSDDPDFRALCLLALGHSRSPEAIPTVSFWALVPSLTPGEQSAARDALKRLTTARTAAAVPSAGVAMKLSDRAAALFRRSPKAELASAETLWAWDSAQRVLVGTPARPGIAADYEGLRLVRQAVQLDPIDRRHQTRLLALALAHDLNQVATPDELPRGPGSAYRMCLAAGADTMQGVLAECLAAHRGTVASAALLALGQLGNQSHVRGGLEKSALVHALTYPDFRVQVRAASAILQIDPQQPFASSTRVVDILKRALRSDSAPRAVICDPSTDRGSLQAGLLGELGYEPVLTGSGKDAFRVAAERSDVELILLHPTIVDWPLSATLGNLRGDARCANIPIILYGSEELKARVKTALTSYGTIGFVLESAKADDLDLQIKLALNPFERTVVTGPERERYRVLAASWLKHIATGRRHRVFDITTAEQALGTAVFDPAVTDDALIALSELPTRTVQQSLADFVTSDRFDPARRADVALKLAFHIQRFGLALSREQISAIHKLPATVTDEDLREALLVVHGSLKPDPKLVGERLRRFVPYGLPGATGGDPPPGEMP